MTSANKIHGGVEPSALSMNYVIMSTPINGLEWPCLYLISGNCSDDNHEQLVQLVPTHPVPVHILLKIIKMVMFV